MNITKRTQAERDIEESFVYIGEENLDSWCPIPCSGRRGIRTSGQNAKHW
jgi:hypothetical protein